MTADDVLEDASVELMGLSGSLLNEARKAKRELPFERSAELVKTAAQLNLLRKALEDNPWARAVLDGAMQK